MFKECRKCEEGMECKDDYGFLKPGYWWRWRNETHKNHYEYFIQNLLSPWPALGDTDVQFPHPIPTPYRCPLDESCRGGLVASCKIGYEGPLCSICSSGYYKQFHTCNRCPSKTLIAGQLCIIAVIILVIITISVWTRKKKNRKDKEERTLIDTLLSKIKIVIGFYQVTYGLLEAFSYISWPDSLRVIGKYSATFQLNILQMAPLHCLTPGLHVDAFGNLFAIMSVNTAVIGFAGVAFGVRKLIVSRNRSLQEGERLSKVSEAKEAVYRNLFFVLYVTYLSTCSKTASVMPVTCQKICQDQEDLTCSKYLKADYSIQCNDSRYNHLVIVGYISALYIIALPVATFIALWRHRRVITAAEDDETPGDRGRSSETITGLRFLFENYKAHSWYWELVEMSRKVIITSCLILVGQETRSYIGLAWVVGGMYGVLFAWIQPIQDVFENRLMTTSLAVTVVNLGIGAVSKIPAENVPSSNNAYMDAVIFNILVLGANAMVMGLLFCKKTWFNFVGF